MSNINLGGGYSSSPQASQHWTLRDRLRNLTTALSGGASLDLRFINQYFYKADQGGDPNQYAALELLDATCTRGSKGWYPEWDFTNGGVCGRLTEYANNAIRYGSQGLLEEASSTNQIRNPRAEGAEAGTPGTLPTNWVVSAGGTTSSVVGSGYENGWPYVDIRLNGTATSNPNIQPEAANVVTASAGDDWAFSTGVRLIAGDFTNISEVRLRSSWATSTPTFISVSSGPNILSDVSAAHKRFHYASTAPASTGFITPQIFLNASGAIDITLRIYAPQLEQAAAPSSPILPPIGDQRSFTRNTETVTGLTTVSRDSRKSNAGEWDFTNGGSVGAYREFLPDVPAVTGKGLLVEEATTNLWENPRFEDPADDPVAFLQGTEQDLLVSRTSGYENGWPYAELHYQKANPSGGSVTAFLDTANAPAHAANETVTISAGARVVSGDISALNDFQPISMNANISGAFNSNKGGLSVVSDIDGVHRRFFKQFTLSGGEDGASVKVVANSKAGVPVDVKIRIYALQYEVKAYPTSPILPPKGDPGAATRAADDVEVANGSWVANSDGPFSLYAEVAAVRRAPENANRNNVVALSDGSFSDVANLHFIGSPHQLRARTQSGGGLDSTPAAVPLSSIADPSGTIRLAAGWDTDDFAYSASGGTQVTDTSVTLPVGMDRLQLGADPAGRRLNGYLKQIRYFPRRLSNAELESLVGN